MIRRGICAAFVVIMAAPVYGQSADKIYKGGDIVTVNDAQPFVQAVAVKAGKILAVGTNEEIAKFQDKKTEVIDLGGHALLPGFVDGHGHCFATGIQAASANLLAPLITRLQIFRESLPSSRRSRSPTRRRSMESFLDSDTTMPS